MSDLNALFAKVKSDRLKFQGLPQESAVQIIEEAIGKLLLLPSAQPIEADAIALADSGVGLLCNAFVPPGVNLVVSPIAVKGVDIGLHALILWLEDQYHKAQAQAGQ